MNFKRKSYQISAFNCKDQTQEIVNIDNGAIIKRSKSLSIDFSLDISQNNNNERVRKLKQRILQLEKEISYLKKEVHKKETVKEPISLIESHEANIDSKENNPKIKSEIDFLPIKKDVFVATSPTTKYNFEEELELFIVHIKNKYSKYIRHDDIKKISRQKLILPLFKEGLAKHKDFFVKNKITSKQLMSYFRDFLNGLYKRYSSNDCEEKRRDILGLKNSSLNTPNITGFNKIKLLSYACFPQRNSLLNYDSLGNQIIDYIKC